MAERVVVVRLSAKVAEYTKGMEEAARKTGEVGSQAQKLAQTREAMQTLGRAGMLMGATLAAGIGVAIAKYAEFDQAMSNVAATGEDARQSMAALRQAAIEAGARTVFSATESANAIEELAKAGLSAKDILAGGLNGALDLAAAGGLGVAQAAGIAATTLQQFKLKGSDASHVADLLAAGAGKAMGDVSDLSQALSQGGLVANQFGISVEETVGTLSAFASAGMLGSDAGTSFRTMLLRMANPTGEAATQMEKLGIKAYDAQGKFVGMAGLAGQLEKGLRGLTQEQKNAALAIIFGQDAIRGANVLLSEGAKGIDDWTKKVNDQGYAAETAATRLDNLKGDIEQLGGALDSLFISMGEGANGPLRGLVQSLTNLVNWFNDLPDWAGQLVLALGSVVAAIGLVGGAALLAVPKLAEFKLALTTLGVEGGVVTGRLGMFAKVAGGAVAGMALAATGADLFTKALNNLGDAAEVTQNKLATAKSGVDVLGSAFGAGFTGALSGGELRDAAGSLDLLGKALDRVASGSSGLQGSAKDALAMADALGAVSKLGPELGKLAGSDLPQAQEKFRLLADSAHLNEKQIGLLLDQMGDYKSALTKAATEQGLTADKATLMKLAMGDAKDGAKDAGEAYQEQADKAAQLQDQLKSLLDTLDAANGANRDAITANIDYQDTLAKVNEQVQKIQEGQDGYAATLDTTTAAGRSNLSMLTDLAKSAWDASVAQLQLDGDVAGFNTRLADSRQRLFDAAVAMGLSSDEAAALRDKILGVPTAHETDMIVNTANARANLDQLIADYNNTRINLVANVTQTISGITDTFKSLGNANGGIYSGGVKAFAGGGVVPGIYPYTPGGIHKFAEQYDEAYISMDPARRARSEQVWVEAGRRFGMLPPASGAGSSTSTTRVEAPVSIQMFDRDPLTVGKQIGRGIERALHG